MSPNKRKAAVALVAALVVLNAWRWWPEAPPAPAGVAAGAEALRAEDFRIQALWRERSGNRAQVRDPFAYVQTVRLEPELVPVAPAPRPVPVREETGALERARLAAFQLEGVLVRRGEVQAFLVREDERYRVKGGERLGEGVIVEQVDQSGVRLRAEGTAIRHTLSLDGN